MDEKPSFSEIIDRWLFDNDGRISGKNGERIGLFFHLFTALHHYGYSKSDVNSNKRLIVNACYNENAKINTAQKAKWKEVVERELGMALAGFEPWSFDMPTFDPATVAVQKTEYPALPDLLKPEAPAETLPESTEILDEPVVERKTFDPEVWDKIPVPQAEYDADLRKLLGFEE